MKIYFSNLWRCWLAGDYRLTVFSFNFDTTLYFSFGITIFNFGLIISKK